MTNHWIDIQNSDCILIMGSNPASNHPVSFKWITKAVEKGARLICVDPRFTQSAAKAHIYAPLRSGTDIAFLGGMIKYILDHHLIQEEYVKSYTNAGFLVHPAFKLPGENNGVFSGLTGEIYDKATWSYQTDAAGTIKKDHTLLDNHCAYQLLKKQYSRYTPGMVSRITGTPENKLLEVYKEFSKTGRPDRAGNILYAVGWTQHTVGTQNIRAMSIIQMLLGNMGIAGGGVQALRGESNVQGSTDHGLLFDILPGYLRAPLASHTSLTVYNEDRTPKTKEPNSVNWLKNFPKYSASYLRSAYGMNSSLEEAYSYLPKLDDGADYSWLTLFDQMYKGKFSGFFAWGMNPAVSGANIFKVRKAMTNLDWMVNVNLFDNETGNFWRGPGMDPKKIKTEVFMLPCAFSFEKEGSITNSGRLMQWRYKAVEPPGEARPDAKIITDLYFRIKKLYEIKGGPLKEAITKLTWNYNPSMMKGKPTHVDIHSVAREINGYFLEDKIDPASKRAFRKGDLVPSFAFLQDDGSTSSGNWLYCNSYTEKGNMAARRGTRDPSSIGLYPEWAWSWPVNRRILYNGASVDIRGVPWDVKQPVITWDGAKWIGDVPDGVGNPGSGRAPFIMKPDGVASLFGPGLADGPFPEHYEPLESPLAKNLLSNQMVNPVIKRWDKPGVGTEMDAFRNADPMFPIVCTTMRVSEHWQSGVLTRWQPWLVEMQPSFFIEMSVELAHEKGIKGGDQVVIKSARGQAEAIAMVTARLKPFRIDGKIVHQVALPWHFGWATSAMREYSAKDKKPEFFTYGNAANRLTPYIGDANTMIPESKAFMVNIYGKRVV
jgi:formate dehydrogenase major subunit